MIISNYRVEPANYITDFDEIRAIRDAVFIVEQSISKDIEFDGLDPSCQHFLARDNHHQAIGTVRLSSDGKIGRMAVLNEWRQQGVGAALLAAAIDKARKLGLTQVTLNAQVSVVGFYQKFGFSQQGASFSKAGIPHQTMALAITPIADSHRAGTKPLTTSIPAEKFNTLEDTKQHIIELINNAGRQICIYTLDLEPDLFADAEVLNAFKQKAISTRGEEFKIIIHNIEPLKNQTHPMFELAHRLSSSFLFRTPVEIEDLKYSSAYLSNDRHGYLFRLFNTRYQGDWSLNLPARSRQLNEEFDRVWQRCRPCTEFRALGI